MSNTTTSTLVEQSASIVSAIESQIHAIEASKCSANKEIDIINRLKSIAMANMVGCSEVLQKEAQRIFTKVDAIIGETRKTVAEVDSKVFKARQRLDSYQSKLS